MKKSMVHTIHKLVILLGLYVFFTGEMRADVYQFAVPAKDADGKDITAFLWVPPDADRIRGVLICGMTLMEPQIAGDAKIREACAAEKLAIVFFNPPVDAIFNYREKNPGDAMQAALADLAKVSGYKEIAVAPWLPFGHSVSSIFASRVLQWKPERCFAGLPFKGALEVPPDDRQNSLLGIPILAVKGQFEEFGPGPSGVLRDFENRDAAWISVREILLQLREKDDRHLVCLLVEAGASHFAWSDRVAAYAALFIRKAAHARIPDWPVDSQSPPKLNEIDPLSGALSSPDIMTPGHPAAALYKEFKGDPKKAYWHLDLELAKAWDAFEGESLNKKAQFVTFADPGTGAPIDAGPDLRLVAKPDWVGPDTLKFAATFLDKAPVKYPQVDGPVDHAQGPILLRAFAGPIEQTSPDTFRVRLDGRQKVRADVLAYHPGDATYRYAEQEARAKIPERLTSGKPQNITFQPVSSMKAGSQPVKLNATSDSGLPVRFYVASGPAVIEGDTLKVAEVPKRALFPVKVTVVAYQYGSAVEPLVQSAPLVTQTVLLEK